MEVLNAANAAFAGGDLNGATQLYERVVNSPPSSSSSAENAQQTAAINGLAHFRGALALLANGDEEQARAHVDALQSADATSAFARLANQLWDQYGMVGSVRGACAQVQPQVASQAGPVLQMLQALGVSLDPQTLCSVPGR